MSVLTDWKKIVPAIAVAAMVEFPAAAALADARTFSADYAVSFLGFTVAKSSFTSSITPTAFEMHGSVASAGLGRFFDSTDGTTVSSGSFAGGGTRSASYVAAYKYGKKNKRTALQFMGGTVASIENDPPLPDRSGDWVRVVSDNLAGAMDPIAATLVRAGSPDAVCGRTIRIFDGEILADIALSHVRSGKVDVANYQGPGVVCHARFTPVAGYHPGNRSLKFLKDKSKIVITFVQLGDTGVYAPLHATIGTQVGTVTIAARRISASQ